MKNEKLTPPVRRLLPIFLILALICGSLGGCGVIIIGGDDAESSQPSAQTTLPETTEAPETEAPADTGREDGTEAPPETETEPEETVVITPVIFPSRIDDAQERLDLLNDTIDISDFDIILVTVSDTVDVVFSEENAPLYAARSNRNSMLYEKYEVDIRTIYEDHVDTDRVYADLVAAVQAGSGAEYYLDLLMIPANRAGGFLAKGLLQDMRTLPFYDTKAGNTDGNVGNKRYFDIGEGTDAPECIYALYFNRTLVGAEATELLYSASLDSSLSFETILTVSSGISGKTSDISVAGGDNLLPGRISADLLGIDYIKKDRSGIPKIAMTDDELLAVENFISGISKLNFYAPTEGGASSIEEFSAGKIPFYMGTLSDMLELYDEPLEWGILTLPSTKDLGAISDSRPIICLPVTNTRLEQTSLWLTAFNASSGEWIRDQFLAVSIENYLRDNNSCLTLHKLLSQKTELDFTRVYSEYYSGLADATYLAAGNALGGSASFSETLKSKMTAVNKKLAKLP